MDFLIILWIFMGLLTGVSLGFLDHKINHRPARYKRAFLWTLLTGPLGFCVLALSMMFDYIGGMRDDQRATATYARQQLNQKNPE